MAVDPQLLELLLHCEELAEQGITIVPKEVCRDCPELTGELLRHLNNLQRLDTLLRPTAIEPELPTIPGYEILRELGRGGMGVVYQARHLRLDRLVALKMIPGGAQASAEELERFRREVEALARLQHPNIVQVHEVGEHAGHPFFVMEYLEGGNLSGRLDGKPWPLAEAAQLGETLARAMHAAHQRGIVHRDLKPGNILLADPSPARSTLRNGERDAGAFGLPRTGEGEGEGTIPSGIPVSTIAKIADFGLAKHLDRTAGPTASSQAILGTPSYMAPEQAAGKSRQVSPATDVYALGVILYQLLTGRLPFQGTSSVEILLQVISVPPVSPALLRPGLPRDLETICLKCLEKEPGKRYTSALTLAEDLRRFQLGEPIQARPIGRVEKLWRWCQRRPAVAALLIILAVTVLVGFVGITWKWLEADQNYARTLEERDRAEKNLRLAINNNISIGALADQLKPLAGTQSHTVKRLLQLAAENYENLLQQAGESNPLLEGKAKMLTSFVEVYLALHQSEKARQSAQAATNLWFRLLQSEPSRGDWRSALVRSRLLLARVLNVQGESSEALATLKAALAENAQLLAEVPDSTEWQHQQALCLAATGNTLYLRQEKEQATQFRQRAVQTWENLLRQKETRPEWQLHCAETKRRLGWALYCAWQYPPALKLYHEALDCLQKLREADSQNTTHLEALGQVYQSLADVHLWKGEPAEARAHYQKAETIFADLVRQDPANVHWQRGLFASQRGRADVREQRQITRDVLLAALRGRRESLQKEYAFVKRLAEADTANAELRAFQSALHPDIASVLGALAVLGEKREENFRDALNWLRGALPLDDHLAQRDPARWGLSPALLQNSIALTLEAAGRVTEAAEAKLNYYQRQQLCCTRRANDSPQNSARAGALAENTYLLAHQYARLAKLGIDSKTHTAQALQTLEAARHGYEELIRREPDQREWLVRLATTCNDLAPLYAQQGLSKESRAVSEQQQQLEARLAKWPPPPESPEDIVAVNPYGCSIAAVASELLGAEEALRVARFWWLIAYLKYLYFQPDQQQALRAVGWSLQLGGVLREIPLAETQNEARQVLQSGLDILRFLQHTGQLPPPGEARLRQLETWLRELPPG